MASFLELLNKFAPEGKEFKFSKTIIDEPQNEWEELMNIGGGQPTYTLGSIGEKAPRADYRGLAPGDTLPVPPVIPQAQAQIDLGLPLPVVPMAEPASPSTAQAERIRTAKAERAANQLRSSAQSPAQPSEELYRRNLSGRNMTVRGGPMATVQQPLEGTLEPRRPAISQTRPALSRPPIEGEVVRRSLTGPGGAGTSVSPRTLPQDPAWVLRALSLVKRGASPVLTAMSPRVLADDTYMDGMMSGPFEGFSFVPPPDYTLGGMLRPQAFDSVNDILIDQYLEGIDPYAINIPIKY